MVDKKISELTEKITPVSDDELIIVDSEDLLDQNKKVKISNLPCVNPFDQDLNTTDSPTFAGLETTASIQGDFEVLTGTTPSINWNTGNHKDITLTGNTTATFTNPTQDSLMTLEVTLGATAYTLTLPSIDWLDEAPTLKDSARTLIALRWNGTAYTGDWK